MVPSTEAQVRDAIERGKPGEALLILARWADSTDELLQSWGGALDAQQDWSLPAGHNSSTENLSPTPVESSSVVFDEPEPAEPEERQAWEARRRIAKDAGRRTADVGVDRSKVTTVNLGAAGFEVNVPAAPQEVMEGREDFAAFDLQLAGTKWWSRPELELPGTDAVSAYAKGGPIWLHAYDRDFVINLPRHLRVAMVQDLETHSPEDAHLLSRDILKDNDPESNRGIQLEAQGVPDA